MFDSQQIRQKSLIPFVFSLLVLFTSLFMQPVFSQEDLQQAKAKTPSKEQKHVLAGAVSKPETADSKASKEVLASAAAKPAATESKAPKMSIRRTEETGDASLYIELSEVMKIRSSAGSLSPQERVRLVQQRLTEFLNDGGNARDIKPGLEGSNVVIRAGETVLVTVDAETARKSKHSPKQLATRWANMIRQGLGVAPLEREQANVASRGFSPALDKLRELPSTGVFLKGFASWYGPGFHGRRCANGERYDMNAMTAAHKTLPFNTMVKVTNNRTGQSTVVRITDRGPYIHNRIIDLSKAAAQAVGMLSSGTAPVTVEVLGKNVEESQ